MTELKQLSNLDIGFAFNGNTMFSKKDLQATAKEWVEHLKGVSEEKQGLVIEWINHFFELNDKQTNTLDS